MTELIFVRHGQTQANAMRRWQGWSDPPLNARGRAQAEAIARRFEAQRGEVAALYTSPLRRAHQTAGAIGARLSLEPRLLDQLKEIHFGELEGTTLADMESEFPALYARWQDKGDMTFQWPGGERRGAFFARAAEACDVIRARHQGERVVIVAHGGTIRACLAHVLPDLRGAWWHYKLDNTGLTRVRSGDDDPELLVLNDTSHLPS